MDLGATVFYAVAAATIVASLGVVVTRNVVYSALLLILALALTGLVYLLLLSDFLALVQILVYGGTVSILLLFALMLTRPRESPVLNHSGWPLAALGAVLTLGTLLFAIATTSWGDLARTFASSASTAERSARSAAPARLGAEELGTALFTTWAVPFEIASVVLLVALVGSLLVARASEDSEATGEVEPPPSPRSQAKAGA